MILWYTEDGNKEPQLICDRCRLLGVRPPYIFWARGLEDAKTVREVARENLGWTKKRFTIEIWPDTKYKFFDLCPGHSEDWAIRYLKTEIFLKMPLREKDTRLPWDEFLASKRPKGEKDHPYLKNIHEPEEKYGIS